MRSYICQLSTTPITHTLDEHTLAQGEGKYIDYCEGISAEERETALEGLLTLLPDGVLQHGSNNTLLYAGGLPDWRQEMVDKVKAYAALLDKGNIASTRANIRHAFTNPLDTDYEFYFDAEDGQDWSDDSTGLLYWLEGLKPQTVLYVGGIVKYHY